MDDGLGKAQVIHQRADGQTVKQTTADGCKQMLAELGIKRGDAGIQRMQLLRPLRLRHVRHAQGMDVAQGLQHVQAQLQIAATRGGVIGLHQEFVHIALQAVGILDRIYQLKGRHLAAVPERLLRAIQRLIHATHELQQIGIHPLDVVAVEHIGIDGLVLQTAAQLRVFALRAMAHIRWCIQRVGHHLQRQTCHVLQLLGHGTAGTFCRLQGCGLQIARPCELYHLPGTGFNQHRRLLRVRQPALQRLGQLLLKRPEHQHAHGIEQGMEHGQLNQGVVTHTHPACGVHDQPGHGRQQEEGNHRRRTVEHHVCHRQTLAAARAANQAHDTC